MDNQVHRFCRLALLSDPSSESTIGPPTGLRSPPSPLAAPHSRFRVRSLSAANGGDRRVANGSLPSPLESSSSAPAWKTTTKQHQGHFKTVMQTWTTQNKAGVQHRKRTYVGCRGTKSDGSKSGRILGGWRVDKRPDPPLEIEKVEFLESEKKNIPGSSCEWVTATTIKYISIRLGWQPQNAIPT